MSKLYLSKINKSITEILYPMKRIVILPLFFVFSCLMGQEYSVATLSPDLIKNANAVIRNQRIDFTVQSPGKASLSEYRAVTIFNERTNLNTMVVHYTPYNKLGRITGKLYDAAGQLIRSVKKSEIKDQSAISSFSIYEDDRFRFVEIEHNDYPYTVVFEYEMTYKDLLSYPYWSIGEFNVAIEKATFNVDIPNDIELFHKAINVDNEPTLIRLSDSQQYQWQIQGLSAVQYEPYAPSRQSLLPFIFISPSIFEAEGYTGSMSSWDHFGQFMNTLMEGKDDLSNEMKSMVVEMTEGLSSTEEKVDVLYKYMQANMRYVSVQLGIGGWQPFSARYVESNKYGDCKALSNFMYAMLKEIGITSYPVLIAAGEDYFEVAEDFTKPLFNHMILHVPSIDYWLECTSNTAPPNYLGHSTSDRNVLLVTEDGGQLARTPKQTNTINKEHSQVAIQLTKEGAAKINYRLEAAGDRQAYWRYAWNGLPGDEFEKTLYENLNLNRFTLDSILVVPDPDRPITKLSFEAKAPKFATKSGKRLFVPLNAIDAYSQIPSNDEHRIHPIQQKNAHTEKTQITIQLPKGFQVESLPKNNSIATPYGSYTLEISQTPTSLIITRTLTLEAIQIPAKDFDQWRSFYKTIAKAEGGKLVLIYKT